MFGFLNIYKPKGITSHDVVSVLRRITKIKQIGHTGTLDPFAEGVLPICIGKATRLIEYLTDDKAYIATIKFGENTDTYDIEGNITEKFNKIVLKEDVIKIINSFTGIIEQIPPMYSAIKYKGKKLYEYAREGIQLNPTPRQINIYEIKLLDFNEKEQTAKIFVKCSKGTYIRTLGYDIGKKLGCGAYLKNLIRVQAGDFNVDESIKLEDLNNENIVSKLIYPLDKLSQPKIEVTNDEVIKISHGVSINNKSEYINETVLLTQNNQLLAVGLVNNNIIKIKKGFYEN